MTLEFDYWLAAETCGNVTGKTADLTEQFAFTDNATACIPASPHSDGGLAAELSVRWSAKSCGLGGFLEMWQTRTCTGTLLSNATVPAGPQGGSCINFSPGKSCMARCSMRAPAPAPAPPQPESSNVGGAVAGALCAVLVAGGLLVYRKKKLAGKAGSDEFPWMQRHFGEPAKDIADSDYTAGASAGGAGRPAAGKNEEGMSDIDCNYAALENENDDVNSGECATERRGSRYPFCSK